MPRAATFVSFPSGPRDAAAESWNDPAQALQIERASQFARELLDAPVVPIEESRLSGAPLADLLSKVPHAAGAIIGGWVIAPDPTPLMLITNASTWEALGRHRSPNRRSSAEELPACCRCRPGVGPEARLVAARRPGRRRRATHHRG